MKILTENLLADNGNALIAELASPAGIVRPVNYTAQTFIVQGLVRSAASFWVQSRPPTNGPLIQSGGNHFASTSIERRTHRFPTGFFSNQSNPLNISMTLHTSSTNDNALLAIALGYEIEIPGALEPGHTPVGGGFEGRTQTVARAHNGQFGGAVWRSLGTVSRFTIADIPAKWLATQWPAIAEAITARPFWLWMDAEYFSLCWLDGPAPQPTQTTAYTGRLEFSVRTP